jgi:hypothetical protein
MGHPQKGNHGDENGRKRRLGVDFAGETIIMDYDRTEQGTR